MKAFAALLMLAALGLPGAAWALGDTDTLYCAQVYAETARDLARAGDARARQAAREAQRRAVPLGERDIDLLNEQPRRHARARAEAQRRLASLPAEPSPARNKALLAAYAGCRQLEDSGDADASPASPAPATASLLGDADILYCAQVYAEAGRDLAQVPGETAALAAEDAQRRAIPLGERDLDLLNEQPRRHAQARAEAQRRLARLPVTPSPARNTALLAAYESCRDLEERSNPAEAFAQVGVRAQLLGDRRFCRDLLARTGSKVSPKIRAQFNADEAAMLDTLVKISRALAQPLPGRPVTDAEDRQARLVLAQRRAELDAAVAGWRGREDPIVREMNRCYDDYAQGRLGGPNVLAQEPPPATLPVQGPPPAPVVLTSRGRQSAPVTAAAPTAPSATGAGAVASAGASRISDTPGSTGVTSSAGTTGATVMESAPYPVDLGEVFHMREIVPGGSYEGIWRRRGVSNVYDALWVHTASGQVSRDVLAVRGVEKGELVIDRQGLGGSYRARVREDGSLAPGRASWTSHPGYRWVPLPAQEVRVAAGRFGGLKPLPEVLHMREVRFGGNYEGIWRRRGDSNVYDALWVHVPTGELTADILVVTGVQRGQLVIQRQQARGTYFAPVLADGRLQPGSASWVSDPAYYWVFLGAQAVSIDVAARR